MKLFFSILLFVFILQGFAQEHPIVRANYERDIFQRFDNYTMKDGLPSNMIRQIFQDKAGFIWLATENGLCRYDGSRFLIFLPVPGDSTSISDNKVTCIAQTSDDFLWIGTKNGLNKLDPLTGRFKQFLVQNAPIVRDNYIRALLVCSDGDLWFETSNGTLTRLNPKTFEYHCYSRKGKAFGPYYNHALFETTDKKIWCGSYGVGLYQFDKKSNEFSPFQENLTKTYKGFGPIANGFDDQKDYLWIANFDHHTTVLNKKSGNKTPVNKLSGVHVISGDINNNVWLGGYWGKLYKYDAKKNRVTYYEHSRNNPQSVLGGEIYTIYCDRSGVIWVGSEKGLSKLAPYKYKFPLYRHIPDLPSPKSSSTHAIFQDNDGDVWFSTGDSALFCYNLNSKTYNNFRHIRNNPNTIGSKVVTGIAQDTGGTLWFTLWNGDGVGSSLNSYNKNTGLFKRHKTCDDYYWYNDLNIYNDQVIVGSWGTGIYYFDPRKADYTKVISQHSIGFTYKNIFDGKIASDKSGNIFYGDGRGMICMYSTTENKFHSFYRAKDEVSNKFMNLVRLSGHIQPIPLWSGSGSSLFHTDKNGIVWEVTSSTLGELNVGDNHYKGYKIPVKIDPNSVCNSRYSNGFWLSGTNVILSFSTTTGTFKDYKINEPIGILNSICEIDETHLLAGSLSGLYRISILKERHEAKVEKVNDFPVSSSMLLSNGTVLLGSDNGLAIIELKSGNLKKIEGEGGYVQVNSMYTTTGGKVFVASNNGLILYDPDQGIVQWWKAKPDEKDQLNSMVIQSVTQTTDGTVWVHTDKGFSKLNNDRQTFTNYYNTSNDAITSYLVSVICTDRNANTWVGTTDAGLSRIDNKTGKVYTYWHQPWDSTSIADGPIAAINEKQDGSIWIGTETGLFKYQPTSDNFIRFGEKEGFESCNIRSIKDDNAGNIWLGTSAGITKFNPSTKQCSNFSWKDGLQSGRFNEKSAARLKDGTLIFGGEEGFNLFNPEEIEVNAFTDSPLISGIWINDSVRFTSCPKNLKLRSDERNIEIHLSYPDYNFPENNKLEYKLEGFDKEFKQISYGKSAVYTNLDPGTYCLIVRGANNDEQWTKQQLNLTIDIKKPFWQTAWGIGSEIIIFGGIFFFAIRLRTRNIKKKNLKLKAEVELQTKLLQLKNEEILAQNDVLEQQKEHIQGLYNQLSDDLEYVKHSRIIPVAIQEGLQNRIKDH